MTNDNDGTALYRAFLVSLVILSIPIKNFAYVAPACYLLVLLLHREYRVVSRALLISALLFVVSSVAILWDHLAGRTVNFPGMWLAFVTYAPLIVVLSESFTRTIDQATYQKFINICIVFVLLQSCVGIVQFVITKNADAVCGTFGLLDGFTQSITIAQVYFTFTMLGMMLFLATVPHQRLAQAAIVVGALTCVLAQSGHQFIFFAASFVACGMLRITRIGALIRTLCAAVVMGSLVLAFYPNTIWLAQEWFHKVATNPASPKRMAFEGGLAILSEPKNFLIGTGLGQYSSRAALISSDEYLTVKLPSYLTGRSEYYSDYIRPAARIFDQLGEGSAMAKPYMSAISMPVEMGFVLCLAFFVVVADRLIWCMRVMWSNTDQPGWIAFASMVGILFFLLCGVIENYAEFTQAVFAPFILFVIAGSRAETLLRVRSNAEKMSSVATDPWQYRQRGIYLRPWQPRRDT